MALTSLLLNEKDANITATGFHPEVADFLQRNTRLNNGKLIDFERVDWADKSDGLGLFDMIIGSDLLYEDEHTQLLADFIENHAKPVCEIIIVDPGRGRKNKLGLKMKDYGYSNTQEKPLHTDYLDGPFKAHILTFKRS